MTTTAAGSGNVLTFFAKVFNGFLDIFRKAETEAEDIEHSLAKFANVVVNVLKTNPTVALIEQGLVGIAETISPALTPIIAGLQLELPNILSIISKGIVEIGKPLQQQLDDFKVFLDGQKDAKGIIYAGTLGTLNAAIQDYGVSNSGTMVATEAQLLTTAQAVHALN